MATTVNEFLALTERLRERVAAKKDMQVARQGANAKATRLAAEIDAINLQIDGLKVEIKAAAADME